MTLHEIDEAMLDLFDALESEEVEEIDEETAAKIDGIFETIDMDRKAKLENIGLYIKEAEAFADMIREEEKKLAERRKSKERRTEWLKRYAAQSIRLFGAVETPRVKLTVRQSEAVEITDRSQIPSDYVKEKVEYVPDKTAIKKAIKEGELIDGAYIETRYNLQIK
jgi:hypothetical protein